jgi:hypothetical protein
VSGKVSTHDLMTDEIYTITTFDKSKDASITVQWPSGVKLSYQANYGLALRLRSTLRSLEK